VYVNLHSHSFYSVLDGFSSPEELAARAKELGLPALALTDHGTLSGNRDFQAACLKEGIKPILGCEMYLSPTDRFDRSAGKDKSIQAYNHLIVIGKNESGYENLSSLSTLAWREGFYNKPRIDREALADHAEGLIVLSGCLNGVIAKAIDRGDEEAALDWTRWFKDTFGDDFYMEIQSHNPPQINAGLMKLARQFDIKPTVTLDCHFSRAEDRVAEEMLLILSTKPKRRAADDWSFSKSEKMEIWDRLNYIYPTRMISFEKLDLYLMEVAELQKSLEVVDLPAEELINNTFEVADKIGDYAHHEGVNLLPKPKRDAYALLAEICYTALREMNLGDEYKERLIEELAVIKDKAFSSYFLIVSDIVTWAKKQGILVGPGRGSAAGSLVCYLMKITNVDPLEYGLLFGRFINAERNDFPDIDIDFQDERRGEVKAYIARKFKNTATVSTFARFNGVGTVKDVSRVFQIPLTEVETAIKNVDSLEEFYTSRDKAASAFRDKYPEVVEYCRQLEGRIRSVGMHSAGVVVSSEPIDKYAPVEYRVDPDSPAKARIPVIALDKDKVEELGLLKIDTLGLKALSVIATAIESIKKHKKQRIDLDSLTFDDPKVFEMLSDGMTRGVFQAEAGPYTHLLKRMKVANFGELVASTALIRPGAMNTIGEEYIGRKYNTRPTVYANEVYRSLTEETYGVVVYQEQVMQTMVELAGMSWAEADKVRKIIGKKKDAKEFDAYKAHFLDGAVSHGGLDAAYAEKLWHDFEAHAGYSFNKSHSVAYSMLTYYTAWLKFYYPVEYMAAILQHEGDKKALVTYLLECRRLGIRMMLPDVNRSQASFAIDGDGIRFGLTNIKYIADAAAAVIMDERPFRSYKELYEFSQQKGSGLSTRIIGALNRVSATNFPDRVNEDPRPNLFEYLGIPSFDDSWMNEKIRGRLTPASQYEEGSAAILFGMVLDITTKPNAKWNRVEIVDETGTATFFTGPDPLVEVGKVYVILTGNKKIMDFVEVDQVVESEKMFAKYLRAKNVSLDAGQYLVLEFNSRKTKAGKNMANAVVVDHKLELIPLLVFPTAYPNAMRQMQPGQVVEMQIGYTKEDATPFVDRVRRFVDEGTN
jgi:DNA polymerase-3 subunit alpha